jgi:hypothetical protein
VAKGKPGPDPKMTALGKELGISRIQVWRLAQKGMPLDSADAARAWRAANVQSRTRTGQVFGEVARLRRAQAELAELDAATRAGRLAPVEEYDAATMEALTIISTQLGGLPGRVAGELAGMTDPAKIRRYLADEINRIRNAAADALEQWAARRMGPARQAPAAAAQPDAGPVG